MSSRPLPAAQPVGNWTDHSVVTFNGQHDTHIKSGQDYRRVTLGEVFAMEPTTREKQASPACIPSSYCRSDAREHAKQRQLGKYVAMCGDVDTGNRSLEEICDAVGKFTAGAAWLIYSSASARDGDMKWRIIMPLDRPLSFADWSDAQCAFFGFMENLGITMDWSLARAAQPVYLPNVPAIHLKSGTQLRGPDGAPHFYRRASTSIAAPGLAITTPTIAAGIVAIRQKRASDDRERERIRREAEQRRANRISDDSGDIIADFNSSNSVSSTLEICGYTQSPRSPEDWRSPNQTGDTYATRVVADKWISLSGSDAASGLGQRCESGCYGDAYDLFVHYKHGGDHTAAFRQMYSERSRSNANVIRGHFSSEPPPPAAGDPGWQEMPEWADSDHGQVSAVDDEIDDYSDEPLPTRSVANVPDIADRMARAGHRPPLKNPCSATPFQPRDPSKIPPRQWIYGRHLLRGSLSLLIAPGSSGKTAFTVGEALAMVTGRPLLGQVVHNGPKKVWLWNLEDSGEELARSIGAGCLFWKIRQDDIDGRLFVDSALDGKSLVIATEGPEGFMVDYEVLNSLVAEIELRQIDVLIVDPFVSSHQLPENDNRAIDAVAKAFAGLAARARCAVCLVHHSVKMRGGQVSADDARGASSLVNAARSVLTINRMTVEEATKFGIDTEKHKFYIRVYDDKANRAPPAEHSDWYRLESQALDNGTDEYPEGDNMPVIAPWAAPDIWECVSADDLRKVQHVVATGEWRKNPQSADWVGHAVGQALGLDADDKTARPRIIKYVDKWIKEGALRVESRKDCNRRLRPYVVIGEAVL